MKSPLVRKLLPYFVILLGIIYGVWPVDILPDVPIIGWFDDLGVIGAAVLIAAKLFANRRRINGKNAK
jgi:uncharacterized membrane protein YkvA (DUF1232 family)